MAAGAREDDHDDTVEQENDQISQGEPIALKEGRHDECDGQRRRKIYIDLPTGMRERKEVLK